MKKKSTLLTSRFSIGFAGLLKAAVIAAFITTGAYAQTNSIKLNASSAELAVKTDNPQQLRVNLTFEEIFSFGVTADRGIFNEISIPGTFSVGEIGTPKLPASKNLIEIPFGADVHVRVNHYKVNEYRLNDFGIQHKLMPVQPSLRKDQSPDDVPFEFDEKLYQKDAFIEHPLASVEVLGVMRGMQIARLTVAPVAYNPVTGIIRVYNDVDVSVEFTNVNIEENLQIRATTFSPYFEPMRQALLNNPLHGYPNHPDLTTYPIKYLIVSDPMFESTLQPFIAWKTMKGFEVVVAYTNVIGNTYSAIQAWIHNQYNSATPTNPAPSFILLVGDTPQIPAIVGSSSGKMTDLYYASVDGDYFPEMYYGRFSAINVAQLQAQIDKTLYYEKYEFADPTYLNKATLIAGSDGTWNPRVGQPTIHYATNNYWNAAHGFTNVYTYLTSPYTGCYTPERIAVSFINYTAHCSDNSWGDPLLSQSMVNNFVNAGQYPLAIGNCCLAANFGYAECIGETWQRAANKGSVAYIGSSPNSYWFEDFYWAVGAFPIVGTNNGYVPTYEETTWGAYDGPWVSDYVSTSGIVFVGNLAVTEVHVQNYPSHSSPLYYWQAYNVLGDPSLVPYHTEGSTNLVSHMAIFPIGLDFYEVTAEPGSLVGISKDGVLHGTALVGVSGTVQVPVTPVVTAGMVDIVVTKPQYIPYITQVQAVPLEGPYVVVQQSVINDQGGNNNGLADYGETITLNVSLKNVGADPTGTVIATATTTSPHIQIIGNNAQNFGVINPDAIATVNNAFTVEVSDSAPNGHVSIINLSMNDGTDTWTSNINITLHAPAFNNSNILVIDDFTGGNNNGQADPGETVDFIFTTTNTGGSAAANIQCVLSSGSPFVTINNNNIIVPAIAPNASANPTFGVSFDPATPIGTPVYFELTVSAGAYQKTTSYIVMVGLIYEDFESGDFSKFNWTSAGNNPWTISTTDPYEGVYAAKSGTITHNQSTQMILEYDTGAADSISFYVKVSSEGGYDFLRFFVNNNQKAQWAGTVNWTRVAFAVDAGMNVFKWEYMKDGSVSSGQDCAWVDYIVFPAPVLCVVPQNLSSSEPTATSVHLHWEAGSNENEWDIKWGLAGFDPETQGTLISSVTQNPYLLEGLEHSTTYGFYVRADCSENGHSAWTGPALFNTLCAEFELPFAENFAGSSVNCWSFPTGQGNWNFGNQFTPPSSQSGAPNAFFTGSPALTNYEHAIATPVIDATEFSNIKLNYILYLNSSNSTTLEKLTVEYKAVDATNWLMLEIFSNTGIGSGSQQYMRFDQALPGVQGQMFQVRFRASGANSANIQGWGLDDVSVTGDGLTAGIAVICDKPNSCEGDLVTFTAIPVNGGDAPVYQWFVNGDEVGENTPEFAYHPEHGDMVCCELTSNMPGVIGSPVMSDIMAVTVFELPVVTWINFAYDTICHNAGAVLLSGGEPHGGVYAGNGVVDGYFHPSVAGPGLHQLHYTYQDAHSCSDYAVREIVVEVCSGIGAPETGSISIYPNPASGVVFIRNNDKNQSIQEIRLYDNYGRQVAAEIWNENPMQINTSQLKPGVYSIEIITGAERSIHKLLVH